MSTFVIAIILFAITYVLLFALPKIRAWIALGSAVVFSLWLSLLCADVEFGFMDVLGAIDFNVLMMLPVITGVASAMGVAPYVLYFGLLVGATLGGNITPIGASANITGIGILRKEGYEVKAKDFMKISVPFTLTAVLSGYLIIWLFWGIL